MNRILELALSCAFLFSLAATGIAQTETKKPQAANEKPAAGQGEAIDFEKAKGYLNKRQRGEKLTADEDAYLKRALAARNAQNPNQPQRQQGQLTPREKTGLKPLSELTGNEKYKGEDGGLYGAGRNTPPEEHQRAAEAALARIKPLDATGQPAGNGKVVFVSISMSNAT